MKTFQMNKLATLTAVLLAGCGAQFAAYADYVPPKQLAVTTADISGSAVKGTLRNAKVSVSQLNGSVFAQGASGVSTDQSGKVRLTVQGKPGFGINSMLKVDVKADAQASMVCDALKCGAVEQGGVVSGDALAGVTLSTLTYLQVPYANSSDGVADASFQANALTTIASKLVAADVAAGRNVSVRQLYEMALAENSVTLLKALGLNSKANVFSQTLPSAEAYANFVSGEKCDKVPQKDANGNPLLDASGNPVTSTVCTDVLLSNDQIRLALLNAAFATLNEGETYNSRLQAVTEAVLLAKSGDISALKPLRERLLADISQQPYLAKLGVKAESVVDVKLAFLAAASSSGPVKEITTSENLASAQISGRNRISAGEAETMAFDGDTSTKWLDHNNWKGAPTVANPSWLQVKFAEPQAVSSVFITSANDAPARDPENFQVLASNDGSNWIELAAFVGESFEKRFERKEFRFSNGLKFSYYKLNISKNKGDDTLMQLAEVEFVGPVYTSADHTDPVGSGVITARNRIGAGEAEDKAFDNNTATKWLDHNDWKGAPTAANPAWVQIDLPEPKAVNTLVLTSANDAPARDPENFNLQGSNDGGKTWLTLSSFVGEGFDKRFERKQFSVANTLAFGSYRLNISKNKGDDTLMQVAEIGLVGPELPDLNHARMAGVQISARFAISDGEAGSKAFDGQTSTKWLDHNNWKGAPTEANPAWVMLQFPQAVTVNKLAITSANDAPARDPENFNLEASNDGKNWLRLASFVGESFEQRFERKLFQFGNDLAFSYYRLNISKNKGDDTLMQVAEIEMIGPQYNSVDHSEAAGTAFSGRNRISANEAEAMAFDNNPQTKWLDHNNWKGAPTEANPSWVQIDLPKAQIVSSLAITSANDAPARDPENFNVEGSNDGGKTWVRLGSWVGESFDKRFERKLFEMGNGFAFSSYRINITKNKGDDTLMQVAEFELIGPEL